MGGSGLLLALLASSGPAAAAGDGPDASYFAGRWALIGENCAAPTSWTMIPGGNFVSQDLAGTWEWAEGKLVLRLEDLAIDEETGEAGGRFRMDGPVAVLGRDRFDLTIAPDVYELQRCPEK
ncbi:hypothetical protein [Parasphingorhabdus sp.]|uniref:hypothetical protein n=1 Tax=Parasphingorhabdus sp. TaxID=2709688 RepID=UPI003002741B